MNKQKTFVVVPRKSIYALGCGIYLFGFSLGLIVGWRLLGS